MDIEKARRERLRWLVLATLNASAPLPCSQQVIVAVVNGDETFTDSEVHKALDYLVKRELVRVRNSQARVWVAELTRYGIDVAEYTVDCDAGIARPQKYWP